MIRESSIEEETLQLDSEENRSFSGWGGGRVFQIEGIEYEKLQYYKTAWQVQRALSSLVWLELKISGDMMGDKLGG